VSGRGRRLAALDRMVRRMERPESVAATALTAPDILAAMTDPDLFGREFGGPSWAPWRAFLAAFFGLPLDAEQSPSTERTPGATLRPWRRVGRRG